jgi:hypothetical protein
MSIWRTTVKNFMAMPILLRLCTGVAGGVLVFVIGTMLPHGSIRVDGRQLTTSEWWAIGAGPFMLIVAFLRFCGDDAQAVSPRTTCIHCRLDRIVHLGSVCGGCHRSWSCCCVEIFANC